MYFCIVAVYSRLYIVKDNITIGFQKECVIYKVGRFFNSVFFA